MTTPEGGASLEFFRQSRGQEVTVATTSKPIRILVVDDHLFMRDGLIAFLDSQEDMTVVAWAADGHEAVQKFIAHKPDLTVMDLRLPLMSGVDAIAAICKINPRARTVILTSSGGGEDVRRAFEAGARFYLLKDMSGEEVLEGLRAAHRGQRSVPPEIAQEMADRIPAEDLSPREERILHLIAQGMSNKELAASLQISSNTIKYHMKSILNKLGAEDRTQAVISALRRGIVRL